MELGVDDRREAADGHPAKAPSRALWARGDTHVNPDALVRRGGFGPVVPQVEIPVCGVVAGGAVVVVWTSGQDNGVMQSVAWRLQNWTKIISMPTELMMLKPC